MKKIGFLFFFIVILAGLYLGWTGYQWIYAPNVILQGENHEFFVSKGSTFEIVTADLVESGTIKNERSFRFVAGKMKYEGTNIKPGRYILSPEMSNRELIRLLRSGEQIPIRLTLQLVRNINQLSGVVSEKLAFDSSSLISYLLNEYVPQSELNKENILSLFIPNTYELYWTTSPKKFVERMQNEHDKFWKSREAKANDKGLSKSEVYTMASIVERETQASEEKPIIAGVYLNRLEKGMLLQADPTIIYALDDYSIRRVLKRHLEIDSPYNTYKYTGLPPGPITMPSMSSIESVLNADKHNYLFFCAKPGNSGRHAFAKTLSAHLTNARTYQRWLNEQGIR
jgi:UPF0755 protein